MSFLISDALAATSDAAAPAGGGLSMLVMPIIFLFIFYFMLWRPQSKRAKEQRDMVEGLQTNDEIVMNGGMLAKIHEISENFLVVTVSEGITVTIQRNAVSNVLPKGTITTF